MFSIDLSSEDCVFIIPVKKSLYNRRGGGEGWGKGENMKDNHKPIIKPIYVDKHAIWAGKREVSAELTPRLNKILKGEKDEKLTDVRRS